MQNARLDQAETRIEIARIIITSEMQVTTSLWQKGKRN